jgi:fido (protein-threonine AMPylation protein)
MKTRNDSAGSNIVRGRPSRDALFKQFASAAKSLASYGGLPSAIEAKTVWDDIWFLEAHNSTAIEGNTLVLREVKALLEKHRSVGGKALKDYLEVEGYGRAADWVYSQAKHNESFQGDSVITLTEIRHIHEMLVKNVWDYEPHPNALPGEKAGAFRQHDIYPFAGGMTPPPWTDVPSLLSDWVRTANQMGREIMEGKTMPEDVPMILARLHCAFEHIHPFLDGNGRTGRLVINLFLVRLSFPPAIILKQRRSSYLKALDKADKGNLMPLAEIFARCVIDNINRFVIPAIAGTAKLVPLKSLETKDISYASLRQAASRGKLNATMGTDGIWYSSAADLKNYQENKYKRSRDLK